MTQPNIQRLRPFLLLLASDQPGEVVAAATALIRTLKATGHDLHDLWQIINSATTPAPRPEQPKSEPPPEVRPWRDIAIRIIRSGYAAFKDKEIDFLNSIVARGVPPTEKQQKWLNDIAAKVGVQ
jgi:hypothetical protein